MKSFTPGSLLVTESS